MILCSVRVSRRFRRMMMLFLALALVIGAGRVITGQLPAAASTKPDLGGQHGKTEEQRLEFVQQLGWVVEPVAGETAEVVIPREWDEIYQNYNEMQKEQGLNLSRLKGKRCTRYTYLVKNHPSGQTNVRLNLLVCKGKIVGGDVCSLGLDGFMHVLYMPQAVPELPKAAEPKGATGLGA